MSTPSIERDDWLYVWADDEAAARRFFGLPPETEVRLHETDGDRKCWAVKASAAVDAPGLAGLRARSRGAK